MPWTIILEDERHRPVSSISKDFDIKLNIYAANFRLLCYLDPYGDAIFNHLQMDDLIQDLQTLNQLEANPLLAEIQALAELCKKEAHTYLGFYGD